MSSLGGSSRQGTCVVATADPGRPSNAGPTVFIALATHNGASFVVDQVESIRRQSFSDWTLLVRDDASSDGTPELLRGLAAVDRRIVLVEDDRTRLGAAQNFGRLMEQAYRQGAEYLFFADQDDVWQPDKLHRQLQVMAQAERSSGQRRPYLVYSDLAVVDEQLHQLHRSFLKHSRLYHEDHEPWKTLIGRSYVLGCACLINRPLMEFALPVPGAAVMHDWWVALCAACVGGIAFLDEPLVLYRRHAANASGPAGFWSGLNPLAHSWKKRWRAGTANFRRSLSQVEALRQRLAERAAEVPRDLGEALDRCACILSRPRVGLGGAYALWRLGVPQLDLPRRLLYYLCLLMPAALTAGEQRIC